MVVVVTMRKYNEEKKLPISERRAFFPQTIELGKHTLQKKIDFDWFNKLQLKKISVSKICLVSFFINIYVSSFML